jgi:hypothetical protein
MIERGKERQVNARCKIDNVAVDFAHIIDAHATGNMIVDGSIGSPSLTLK